jgi:hypothetical protein
MAKTIKKETLRHMEAFEYFYSLGDSRSLRAVAEKFTISETSAKLWARSFGWDDRVTQRDIEAAKKLEKKTMTTVVNEKANYRKIIRAAVGDFVARLKEGQVKIETVAEFEKLVKLDLLLMGENTEKTEVTGAVNVNENEEKKEIIRAIASDPESIKRIRENYRRRTREGVSPE